MIRLREAGRIVLAGVGLAVILFVGGLILDSTPPPAIGMLLVGWLVFPFRAAGQMTVNWSAVVGAAVLLAALVGAAYAFFRLFFAPAAARRGTVAVVGTVVLMFVLGTAVTGMGRQAGWLAANKWTKFRDPMDPWRAFYHPASAAEYLKFAVDQFEGRPPTNSEDRRWANFEAHRGLTEVTDRMHFVPVRNPDGRLTAVVGFWRDPAAAEREGIFVAAGGEWISRPRGELADVIAEYSRSSTGAQPPKGAP